MKTISPIELQLILAQKPSATVLDVRTPVEFAAVRIPQSKNIPLDELNSAALNCNGDEPIYLICSSGQRAMRAADKLAGEGIATPIVVAGGTQEWIKSNLPVLRSHTKVLSLERQVRIAAGSLVLVGFLLGWFVDHWFFLVTGLVGAGLIFAGITDFCGMGLLLAKMTWNKKLR